MGKQSLDALGVSAFCESLAMMLHAGISTDEAVSLLQTERKTGGLLAEALQKMQEKTEQSAPLSEAMADTGIFPDYCLQTVALGEQTGRLEQCLDRLSKYYAGQHTLTRRLRSAVVYPAAMLGLMIAVLAVMLFTVLPVFTEVYTRMTGSLNASSYRYVGWAYGFCRAALGLMILLAALLVVGLLLWNHGKRAVVERVLYRIPICAAVLRTMGLYRFTASMEACLASGALQDEALQKSLPMTDCAPVEALLRRCERSMQEGRSFANAAYAHGLFEPIYGRMLLAGERSGSLETVLARLNGLLQDAIEEHVSRLVDIVDPLLSGVLMLTVGMTLLSVMLPLIGMMNGVG